MRNYPQSTANSRAGSVSARSQNHLAVRENAPDDNPLRRAVCANVFHDFTYAGVLQASDALLHAFKHPPAVVAAPQTNNTIVIESTANTTANNAEKGKHGIAIDAAQFGEWQTGGDLPADAVVKATFAEAQKAVDAAL